MAISAGRASRYLMSKDLKYYAWYGSFIVLVGAVFFLILKFLSSESNTLVVALIVFVILVKILDPVFYGFYEKSGKYFRGRAGEDQIFKELKKLDDSFYIFQDLKLGRGNIDFAVVGPTGIYIVEAKSMGGDIDFNGRNLTINGRLFEKDYLAQARGEAMGLRKYLESRSGYRGFINAILVFSHPYAKIRFGLHQIEGVFVVQKEWLDGLIESQPLYHYQIPQKTITDLIKPLTS